MVSEERKKFAKMRRKMLYRTGSKQFICARCGLASKSVNIHHIEELHQGGENKTENMIPLCGDCHREWDLCHDVGMTFGEFLVSLPSKAWQIATKLGFFKSPHPTGGAIEAVYQVQFSGHAVKYPGVEEDPLAYFKELKKQNELFSAYPYSDHKKMLALYGGFYETIEDGEEFNKYSKNILDKVLSQKPIS